MQEVPVSAWFAAAATQTGDPTAATLPRPDGPSDAASEQHASDVSARPPSSQGSHPSQRNATMAHGGEAISTGLQFDQTLPAAHESAEAPNVNPADDHNKGRGPVEQVSGQASPIGIIPAEPTLILEDRVDDASFQAQGVPEPPVLDKMDGLPQQMAATGGIEQGGASQAAQAEQAEASPAAGTRRLHAHGSFPGHFKSSLSSKAAPQTASKAIAVAAARRPLQHDELQMTAVNPEPQPPEYDFLSGIYERKVEAAGEAAHEPGMPQKPLDADRHQAGLGRADESSEDPPGLGIIDLDATIERWRLQAKPMSSDNQLVDAAVRLHSHAGPLLSMDGQSSQPTSSPAAISARHDHETLRHAQLSSTEQPYAHASAAAAREAAEQTHGVGALHAASSSNQVGKDQLGQQPGLDNVVPLFGPARSPRRAHGRTGEQAQQQGQGQQGAEPASLQYPQELHHGLHSRGPDAVSRSADAVRPPADSAASAQHLDALSHAANTPAPKSSAIAQQGEHPAAEQTQLEVSLDDVSRVQVDAEPVLPVSQMALPQGRLTTPARQVLAARHPVSNPQPYVHSQAAGSNAAVLRKPSLGPASAPGGHLVTRRRRHGPYEPAPSGIHQRSLMIAEDASLWEPESLADKMQSWLDGNMEEVPSGSSEQQLETAAPGRVAGMV